jgi:hypothetical protein
MKARSRGVLNSFGDSTEIGDAENLLRNRFNPERRGRKRQLHIDMKAVTSHVE